MMIDPNHRETATQEIPEPDPVREIWHTTAKNAVIQLHAERMRRQQDASEVRIDHMYALLKVAFEDCGSDERGQYRLCSALGALLAERAVKLGGQAGLDFFLMNAYANGKAALSSSVT